MVWALIDPNGFGDFFPHGDYVGWEERTERYFNEEMTAEQRAIHNNWVVSYRGQICEKFRRERDPLEPHEQPMEFRALKTPRALASLIQLHSGLLAVDETLKAIIETLEPGVHQFWPLRITLPRDKEYPVPYYGMVIRRFLDSFIPEQSDNFKKSSDMDIYFARLVSINHYAGLAFSRNLIGDAHLWRERRLLTPEIYLSDAMQAEITRRRLRIPKSYKLKVI